MPLRDLIKKADNSIAPDRILEGDQYDIKIDALLGDVIALADALDTRTGSGTAGGDLSGTYPNPLVVKLRGKSIPSAAPTTGDYLNYDGTSWIYVAGTSGPPTGAAGGNLSGSYPNPKVIKVQDEAVSATPPTDGQVWVYDGVTTNSWVPTSPTSITANAGSIATYPVAATTPTSGTVLGYTGSTYAPMALPLGTGNILPPSLAGVDYFAGSMGKAAFLTYGDVASYVTVDNLAVIRGNNWTSAGHMRFDDTKRPGWIVFQRSNDAPFILFFSKGLTAPTSDTAIWITNSFDDCDAKTNGATLSFLFSQTMTGTLDPNNFYGLEISSTANINEWIVSTVKVVAGVTTTLSTLTFISNTYPAPLVCLERHSSTFRAWIGRDKDSMKQVAADATIAITPDRLSMTCISTGRPNTVFGINQILRTSEALI